MIFFDNGKILAAKNRIKYLIPRSAYILKSSDFLFPWNQSIFFRFLFI